MGGDLFNAVGLVLQHLVRSPHLPWLPVPSQAHRVARVALYGAAVPAMLVTKLADELKDSPPRPRRRRQCLPHRGPKDVSTVHLPYVDSALAHLDGGGPASWWHHLHWGLYDDPASDDDSPEAYVAAATALTERVVAVAGVADGRTVLDVGCGFGGTLAHVAARNHGCRLAGLNIDERQLAGPAACWALTRHWWWGTAAACRWPANAGPRAGGRVRVPLPRRKGFFREAARVLRPGGTLALSDFLLSPGGCPRSWPRWPSWAPATGTGTRLPR